ncbi:MAG: hypothetical protein AB8I08_17590 [Sandaracinaceae bacterium]
MALEWLVLGGVAAAAVSAMARLARRSAGPSNRYQDVVQSVWQDAADAMGGALIVHPQPALTPRRLTIEVEVEGVPVVLETRVPSDPAVGGTTFVAALYALGEGPRFQLIPRNRSDAPGEAAALGDPALIGRFQLRTKDPDAVAAAFDAAAKKELAPYRGAVTSDGRSVRLEWDGPERQGKRIEQAARLAAALASFGMETLRALAELEGARLTHTETGPTVVVERHHVTVLLQGTATRRGPAYDARAEAERALPELDVRVLDGAFEEGTFPSGLIDGDAAERLRAVGDARLTLGAGRVKLLWDDAPNRAQAEAGVSLVAKLAAGVQPGGAFR